MIRQGKIWLAAGLLAIGTSACFDDPSSDLRGGATALNIDRTTLLLTPAASVGVLAYLQDAQGNPLPIESITWESVDPAIATVAADAENLTPGLTSARAFITGVAGGATYIRATAGGFSDSVLIGVFPAAFTGSVAPSTTTLGTAVVITAPAGLSFVPADVVVRVNGGLALVTAATASSVTIQSPAAAAGEVTLEGLVLTGSAFTLPELAATTALTVTDASEPGNNASATAAAVTGLSAVGDSAVIWGSMSTSGDAADYYTFTMPATGTINVRLSFVGDGSGDDNDNPDFDVVVCTTLSGTGTCTYTQDLVAGNGASSVSNPEVGATSSIASGAVVYVRTYAYVSANPTPYRLRLWIQ